MLARIIKSAIETVRPPPVSLDVLVDLRQRTFDLGGEIEVVVAITARNDAVQVVQCGVTLVLEFEIERIHTNSVSAAAGMRTTVSIPKSVKTKSVDSHRLATDDLLSDTRLEPTRHAYPGKLSVPEDLPRPPADAISSTVGWKVVAELELSNGIVLSAEQAVTQSN